MRIGQLARSAGVGVETVRYYQRIGLLPEPAKPVRGSRSYGLEALDRLRFIRRAQQLGFSLAEIADLLQLTAAECADVLRLATEKLATVEDKILSLQRIAAVLEAVVSRCRSRRPHEGCPLIAALSGAPQPGGRRSAASRTRTRA